MGDLKGSPISFAPVPGCYWLSVLNIEWAILIRSGFG